MLLGSGWRARMVGLSITLPAVAIVVAVLIGWVRVQLTVQALAHDAEEDSFTPIGQRDMACWVPCREQFEE